MLDFISPGVSLESTNLVALSLLFARFRVFERLLCVFFWPLASPFIWGFDYANIVAQIPKYYVKYFILNNSREFVQTLLRRGHYSSYK